MLANTPTRLPLSGRTVLLDINAVRAARGISTDQVHELVESGRLVWVFNVALKQMQNWRFWAPEVADPVNAGACDLDQVITNILPASRQSFRGSEIGQIFLLSRPSVKRLGARCQGMVENGVLRINREPLAEFLRENWVGGKAAWA